MNSRRSATTIGRANEPATVLVTFLRIPAAGDMVKRSWEGSMRLVQAAHRPDGPLDILNRVDARLRRYDRRLYSVDCALRADGAWILLEINAPPGLMERKDCDEEADVYFKRICDLLFV